MGRFFPLYIRRSDGKVEITAGKHRIKERNEPTKEQLDRKPDANGIADYYREVDSEEQKHLDWRRKLGGMLARELGMSDAERGHILVSFPEGYRLYEHVKRAEEDSKIKLSKNHAGGGNERQDAYLYGHPLGRKKRFRSPNDFYPHLHWLATDEEGDPDNCSCKLCCPEEIDERQNAAPVKTDVKRKVTPVPETKAAVRPDAPTRQVSASSVRPSSKQSNPPSTTSSTAANSVKVRPMTNVQTTDEQKLDLMPSAFLFRKGELVWFIQTLTSSWGLGIVFSRRKQGTISNYTIQPLSHPFQSMDRVDLSGDDSLRPWLAWSVPGLTCNALNTLSITYDTADWDAIRSGQYGQGDLVVDGSILAAKRIDQSLTPTDPPSAPNPASETFHAGLFLGGERIWTGDIVWLRGDVSPTDILVITQIMTSAGSQPDASQIHVRGDQYSFREVATSPADNPQDSFPAGFDTRSLPTRLISDLRKRNSASIPARGVASTYHLVRAGVKVAARDIKGRWYEGAMLAALLATDEKERDAVAKGVFGEQGGRMNSRLNNDRDGDEIWRASREAALARAVPSGFSLEEGAEMMVIDWSIGRDA